MPKPFLPLSPAQFRDLLNPGQIAASLRYTIHSFTIRFRGGCASRAMTCESAATRKGAERASLELCEGARFSTRASR